MQNTENTKLTSEIISENLHKLPEWADIDELKINKTFKFINFVEALSFVNQVGKLAEKHSHHPDIHIYYNQVNIELWSHDVQGLSAKDFDMARGIEDIFIVFRTEEVLESATY